MCRKAIESVPFMWILVLCLIAPVPLHAQVAGATLSGTITDGQGGVVPGVSVSVMNTATGVTTSTKTNDVGAYSVPNLNAGDYQVSASAPGFSTAVAKLTLTVGQQQVLNLALMVGSLSEAVEVTAAAPLVELASSTISGNVSATTLRELPLNGRDWASLATLQPGVAFVRTHPLGTQASRGLGIHMTISGGRPTQNSYRLDGAIVNDYSNAGPGSVLGQNLGVDAIQEFSVLTSNYSAEYGFTSGGVINAITRSGSNTFHGSVFDFLCRARGPRHEPFKRRREHGADRSLYKEVPGFLSAAERVSVLCRLQRQCRAVQLDSRTAHVRELHYHARRHENFGQRQCVCHLRPRSFQLYSPSSAESGLRQVRCVQTSSGLGRDAHVQCEMGKYDPSGH